ncbi:lipase member H-like isoform X1 [Myxocyprinus asiaticus]|uniref:lipase member H-like isoform X1 n=2 Tax=Myxocyprinus asiaticus TaxID=70543 RepID=UPI0022217DD2|nr:lipase member H-like isoform X1 [Myxocyprinus asiaticus]
MVSGMFFWGLLYMILMLFDTYTAQECEKMTDLDLQHSIVGTAVNVRLLLYTRENVSCGQLLSHQQPFSNPHFDLRRLTTFLIHGYRPTGSPPVWMYQFVKSLLNQGDMNLIVVDWNHGATNINYLKVVKNTRVVAAKLIDLIHKMKENGAALGSIHMIGISLGAHISGFTGAKFNGEIGRITALDPAGPQFNGQPISDRLDSSDAQFVEALHTDIDALGYRNLLGHIDYYANGGADQPGCPKTIFSGSEYFKCDHQRSVFLYMSSVNGSCPIIAYPCDSYTDFLDGKCMDCGKFGSAGCPVFGYDAIRWKEALVQLEQTRTYFQTNNAFPYCKFGYKVDIVTWNQQTQWGSLTIKLEDGKQETQVELNHKSIMFAKYVETSLLAQFDRDIQPVKSITVKFCKRKGLRPRKKLRLLRIRLTPLQNNLRPLCRYDLLLEENKDVTFRPIPCEDSNF